MIFAGVMELADVLDSKSSGSDTVPVRPRSPAPNFHTYILSGCSAVGDVSERRQWRMQRGKRSGATRSIAKWITSETTMLQQEARRTSWKNLINTISGCSAVGSAPALGECPTIFSGFFQSWKPLISLGFRHLLKITKIFLPQFFHNF